MKTDNQLQLVSFEQAKRLKEAGFDWECQYYYVKGDEEDVRLTYHQNFNGIVDSSEPKSAPTVALALKWFRDVKNIHSGISYDFEITNGLYIDKWGYRYSYTKWVNKQNGISNSVFSGTYESSESALLDVLLNLIENKQ